MMQTNAIRTNVVAKGTPTSRSSSGTPRSTAAKMAGFRYRELFKHANPDIDARERSHVFRGSGLLLLAVTSIQVL
jgi:hypothetical protein